MLYNSVVEKSSHGCTWVELWPVLNNNALIRLEKIKSFRLFVKHFLIQESYIEVYCIIDQVEKYLTKKSGNSCGNLVVSN